MTNPIPLFGIPPIAPAMSFKAFDVASVRYSVSSIVPRQPATPMQEAKKPKEGLFAVKADVATKGKFLDPMIRSPPPHMDFIASESGDDISLLDKPVDMATICVGGSVLLIVAGGQVKIEAPPRYSRKR